MRPFSLRVTLVLLWLLLTQAGLLSIGFYIAHHLYQERVEEELSEWASTIDPISYEQLVLQTEEKNVQARDMLVYELILKSSLSFATVLTPDQLPQYLAQQKWAAPCKIGKKSHSQLCYKNNSSVVAGILPLLDEDALVGYLVRETPRGRVVTESAMAFYKHIGVTLIIGFFFNVIGLWAFFRTSLNRELKALLHFVGEEKWGVASAVYRPRFRTREFEVIRRAVSDAIDSLRRSEAERQRLSAEVEKAEIATKVAHDIRSPLAALQVVVNNSAGLPEQERTLARAAISRITGIANNLLDQYPLRRQDLGEARAPRAYLLAALVTSVVSEKQTQFLDRPDVTIDFDESTSYGVFITVDPGSFRRVLSNLINNAVEAIPGAGRVEVIVDRNGPDSVMISVSDDGVGIPSAVVPQLMNKGFSFQKTKGHGLGLFSAREAVESWGGTISIASEEGQGTTVTFHLHMAAPPKWYLSELGVTENANIIVLDDDRSIHDVWAERLKELGDHAKHISLVHCFSGEDFRRAISRGAGKPMKCLVDFELAGETTTGLDLITELGIAAQSILVTGRQEESPLVVRCEAMGLKMLPKSLAASVPIRLV